MISPAVLLLVIKRRPTLILYLLLYLLCLDCKQYDFKVVAHVIRKGQASSRNRIPVHSTDIVRIFHTGRRQHLYIISSVEENQVYSRLAVLKSFCATRFLHLKKKKTKTSNQCVRCVTWKNSFGKLRADNCVTIYCLQSQTLSLGS